MKCKHCEAVFVAIKVRTGPQRTTCSRRCAKAAWKKRNPNNRKEDYAKNAERYKEKARAWGRENATRKQARNRADHAANPTRYNAYSRKWREENPKAMQAAREKWAKENPERLREMRAAYAKANPEKVRDIAHRRRARKLNCDIGASKMIVMWEKGWRKRRSVACYWCGANGRPSTFHVDHVIPLAKGGPHEIGNLCISCAACNFRKSSKPLSRWNEQITEPVLL